MDYDATIDFIYSREKFGIKLGLNNITELLNKVNNPQNKFKSIHIAGTNGKGSTSAFISSILDKVGYKVGTYTSPHLVNFRERIKINSKLITKSDLTRILEKIIPHITTHTFFEVTTAIAFIYFAEQKVDFAVVEVGMGGRLDATNVLIPEVSVITGISFDHSEHLGDTLDKIAFEKAGIIKSNVPVIIFENINSKKIIEQVCIEKKSELINAKSYNNKISLRGEFQHINAGLAFEVIKNLRKKGYIISEENIEKGFLNTKWPGRMDFVKENILFDCAHNLEAIKLLVIELKKLNKNIILITSIMKDKQKQEMCQELDKIASQIILTKASVDRAANPEELVKFITKPVIIKASVSEALNYAKSIIKKDELIVLTGSIFTVGNGFQALSFKPFDS